MKCAMKACGSDDATLVPVLMVRPPVEYEPVAPIEIIFGIGGDLVLCAACAKTASADDLVTDTGWDRIVGVIRAQGKVLPDRARSRKLKFIARDSEMFASFNRVYRAKAN